jgi:type IV pilus biogenesis protein CpaD/CtpE
LRPASPRHFHLKSRMKINHPLLRAAVLGAAGSLLLSGCASDRAKAQAKAEKAALASGQYVWYTPVGTNIPVLIPKDQARTTQAETDEAQRVFADAQRMGTHPETGPTSGIPGAQASTSPK